MEGTGMLRLVQAVEQPHPLSAEFFKNLLYPYKLSFSQKFFPVDFNARETLPSPNSKIDGHRTFSGQTRLSWN